MRIVCLLVVLFQFIAAPAEAAPTIFWFNDPVGPDQAVLVTGEHLGDVTAVTISRVPDRPSEKPGVPQTVEILQPSAQSLKFIVPKGFASGIYSFTLASPQGSVSARLNLPTVYWSQGASGEEVSPGGWLRIFGRNIVRSNQRARLLLMPETGGAPVPATTIDGDLWQAKFVLPKDTKAGAYRLRLSNGDGGDEGWADAGVIRVKAAGPISSLSIDVRSYGAIGDGRTNNSRAVAAAVAAAVQGGGGTVYFPPGRYLLLDPIVVPPGVRIVGEATDRVNLIWQDLANPPDALIKGTSNFSIENVTIYTSNHGHVVVGGFLNGDTPAPDASDIAIRRVRIRASAFRGLMDPDATYKRMTEINRRFPNSSGPDTIRLTGNRLEITDCDILGSGRSLFLFKAVDAIVSGTTLSNGRYGWYSITGSRRVIFENNLVTAVDLQGNGGGINTISNAVSASENILVAHNTFKGIYGMDREAVTSDGPGGYYFGHAISLSPDRLSLLDSTTGGTVSPDWTGAGIMVLNGTGSGQFARVRKFNPASPPSPRSLELDRSLRIALDSTSIITVVQAQQNYIVVDNQFEDSGVAVQNFGTGLNHVIAGNTSVRASGFFAIGLYYMHVQATWQVQFLNNEIVEGNTYRAGPNRQTISDEAAIGIHAYQSENRPNAPTLARAMVIRGNRLRRDARIEIKGQLPLGIRDVIVEDNVIGSSRAGLSFDQGVASALERNNVIEQKINR